MCTQWREKVRGYGGRGGGGGEVVVSLVFFIGKTSVILTFLEHLNRTLGSSLIANFLLTKNFPHRVITYFREVHRMKPVDLTNFKFENTKDKDTTTTTHHTTPHNPTTQPTPNRVHAHEDVHVFVYNCVCVCVYLSTKTQSGTRTFHDVHCSKPLTFHNV